MTEVADDPVVDPPESTEDPETQDPETPPEPQWDFSDQPLLELVMPGVMAADPVVEDNLVWKDIFTTEKYLYTPTLGGLVDKPLKVVASGATDLKAGVLSMEEIEDNFNNGVVRHVEVPLTDEAGKDHKQLARLNTGFVRRLKRVTRADGSTVLRAGIEFTEPDVLEKVKRGTYADCSAGVFPIMDRKTGKVHQSVLRHVVITNTPFVDNLEGYEVAASDDEKPNGVKTLAPASADEERLTAAAAIALKAQGLDTYSVVGVENGKIIVKSVSSDLEWVVAYELGDDKLDLDGPMKWVVKEPEADNSDGPQDTPPPPVDREEPVKKEHTDDLAAAREAREQRLKESAPVTSSDSGGRTMGHLMEDLVSSGLELSDEQRAIVRKAEVETREKEVDSRIDELKTLGFSECPGALKWYREVMLSDDGGPAGIIFSDEGDATIQRKPTAVEILDRFIKGLPTEDGKLAFTDQALLSGNDNPPPVDDEKRDDSPEAVKARARAVAESMGDSAYTQATA